MTIDFPTLLGALGVILTIAFFVIGYRQTIGARKERARAANKIAVDALFRRLTLEAQFAIDSTGIAKLLSGWAIDERVRLSDMLSAEDLEAVLFCKIIESDYLSGDQRTDVIRRLGEFFKNPRYVLGAEGHSTQRTKFGTETALAVASGATALVIATLAASLVGERVSDKMLNTSEVEKFLPEFLGVVFLITLTVVALTQFTRLREATRSIDDSESPSPDRIVAVERSFMSAAKHANRSVEPLRDHWADFVFRDGGKQLAVELKFDVNAINSRSLRALVERLEKSVIAEGFSSAFIASVKPPSPRTAQQQTDRVKIVSASELLDLLRIANEAGD